MGSAEKLRRNRIAGAKWRAANRAKTTARNAAYYAADREGQKARAAAHRAANPEMHRAATAAWRAANRERFAAMKRAYRIYNAGHVKAYRKAKYELGRERELLGMKAWKRANPHKNAEYCNGRKAAKMQAMPPWADLDAIAKIYEARVAAVELFEIPVHVDHTVPLKSKLVCGLHCEANLRLFPGRENQAKSNRSWPDMWS